MSVRSKSSGAPDVILRRLPEFIQEFSSSPNTSTSEYQAVLNFEFTRNQAVLILPDFLYELQPELASKMPNNSKGG